MAVIRQNFELNANANMLTCMLMYTTFTSSAKHTGTAENDVMQFAWLKTTRALATEGKRLNHADSDK